MGAPLGAVASVQSCAVPWLYGARLIVRSHRCVAASLRPKPLCAAQGRKLPPEKQSRPFDSNVITPGCASYCGPSAKGPDHTRNRANEGTELASNRHTRNTSSEQPSKQPHGTRPSERTQKQPGANNQARRRAKTNKQNEQTNKQGSKQANSRVSEAMRTRDMAAQHSERDNPTPKQAQRAVTVRSRPAALVWSAVRCSTPFMDRLALYLHYFIHHKQSNDPGWMHIKVGT